jgi:hypothetical protein
VPQAVECLLLKWKPGVQIPIQKIYIQKQNHTKKQGKNGILIKEIKNLFFAGTEVCTWLYIW